MSVLLDIQGLTVNYGGLFAVNDVSLGVDTASCVGLIGPNGAGKTTLIDAVTGFTPSTGTVTFDGTEIQSLTPHRRARRGLCRTFQSLELFEELSIRENLLLASERAHWWSTVADMVFPRPHREGSDAIGDALELLGISAAADRLPGDLSLGQRKLVTIARALAMRPMLLLLDEPAAGLDSRETLDLGKTLTKIVESGVTVVLVDHDMGLVLGVCDTIHVLEFGRLIASGPPSHIRSDEDVIHAYLGGGQQANGSNNRNGSTGR
jgi:ABC-type branched-subunit amino acid transport system ATPase component